jgi:hypothetical protein
MSTSRESVFAALFTILQGAYAWQTCSRRLANIQDLAPEALPAAYQLQGPQALKYDGGTPTVGMWQAQWLLYAISDDPNVAPSTQLNAMVDAVLGALKPANGPLVRNTLGGRVEYAAAEGDIDIFEGVLGDRAIAVIPIRIQVPGF